MAGGFLCNCIILHIFGMANFGNLLDLGTIFLSNISKGQGMSDTVYGSKVKSAWSTNFMTHERLRSNLADMRSNFQC